MAMEKFQKFETFKHIQIVLIDINKFYDEKDQLNIEKLRRQIKEINPLFVLASICFWEIVDINFTLEILGIFHQGGSGLQLTSKGKLIHLDPTQTDLLSTMADPCNAEKTTILHGPEGSGKTLLAIEVLKMKLIHYVKKMKLPAIEAKDKIRVVICVSYTGEDQAPLLLKQLIEETNDIKDFCTLEFKPLVDLTMKNPDSFQRQLNKFLSLKNQKFVQSIVMIDHLYPGFVTDRWIEFKDLANIDFVLALSHAFNDGVCLTKLQSWFQGKKDYQDIMEQQGVKITENTVFCHLRKSYRCTQELLSLTYYMLMHSPHEEQLYKQKSFNHLPKSFSGGGQKPLWLQVTSLEAFIHFSDNDDRLKLESNVMIIYDPTFESQIIYTLRGYAAKRNWRVCPSTSVMGSEASTVIIFNMKTIHFEALSRAVLQLIFVTTNKEK